MSEEVVNTINTINELTKTKMRKLFDSAIETITQKRFSYIDLVVIAIIEWIILTIR